MLTNAINSVAKQKNKKIIKCDLKNENEKLCYDVMMKIEKKNSEHTHTSHLTS